MAGKRQRPTRFSTSYALVPEDEYRRWRESRRGEKTSAPSPLENPDVKDVKRTRRELESTFSDPTMGEYDKMLTNADTMRRYVEEIRSVRRGGRPSDVVAEKRRRRSRSPALQRRSQSRSREREPTSSERDWESDRRTARELQRLRPSRPLVRGSIKGGLRASDRSQRVDDSALMQRAKKLRKGYDDVSPWRKEARHRKKKKKDRAADPDQEKTEREASSVRGEQEGAGSRLTGRWQRIV